MCSPSFLFSRMLYEWICMRSKWIIMTNAVEIHQKKYESRSSTSTGSILFWKRRVGACSRLTCRSCWWFLRFIIFIAFLCFVLVFRTFSNQCCNPFSQRFFNLFNFIRIHCGNFQALRPLIDALGLGLRSLLSLLFHEHFIPLILIVDTPRRGGGARFAVYYGCAIWQKKCLSALFISHWV